jgi:enamine deaminase RidA (YjgF/YER057c/UK114 family)
MKSLTLALLAWCSVFICGCAGTSSAATNVSAGSQATRASPSCRHRNAQIEQSIGFCQAVRVGDVLYVSGVPADGPMAEAVPAVYRQLQAILAANGLTFADVVKENVYATDLDAFIAQQEARKTYYGTWFPSATWVQVERLFMPSFVLEVEVVAHFPGR